VLKRIRAQASYANVLATIALFIAVGGTSYATIALPRDSVGQREIKSRAVGSKELDRGAVTSRAIKNHAIRLRDLSDGTKASLAGVPGPPGPPGAPAVALRAAFNSAGERVAGSSAAGQPVSPNKLLVDFGRELGGCVPAATLARNSGGAIVDPGPGRIVVAIEGNRVAVETFRPDGTPDFLPFNVIVAC
jgi:hypothetical protein